MDSILNVENITIKFGGLTAVNQLEFSIRKGELMGLIGPNGSGKTTMLNGISGIYKPSDGQIKFDGSIISGKRAFEISRMGIGRSFQNNQVFKSMSVIENIMVGYHHCMRSNVFSPILGLPAADKEEKGAIAKAIDILEFIGLPHLRNQMVTSLAYGQQKLVEIARALAANPKLLLLDEPAAGLNPFEKVELEKLIRRINENGITILMVEHDMKMVMRLCRHIVVLNFGKKIAEGNPESVSKNQEVIKAYLGEEDSIVRN
jgi:branched-chain amino acid transport system ATP-binding protein